MSSNDIRAHEYVAKAVADRASADIREALRERIMKDVSPEIDSIIDAVLAELKVDAASWRDPTAYGNPLITNLVITWKAQTP